MDLEMVLGLIIANS